MPIQGKDKLAELRPELAEEWMVEENKPYIFEHISVGSNYQALWRCKQDPIKHIWPARVNHRANGSGCPYCSGRYATPETSLLALFPHIAAGWHPTKNGELTPDQVKPHSDKKVIWQCAVNASHVWPATISSRVRGNGCPMCSNRVATLETCLQTACPDLAQEWYAGKENGDLTPTDVVPGSEFRATWQCRVNPIHKWTTSIRNRAVLGSGCPHCAGQRATPETSLFIQNPALAAEWHPTKNKISPDQVLPHSNRKVWWQCLKDPTHPAWQTTINSRSAGTGCPYCAGQLATPTTSLAALFPHLAAEWHPTENHELTPDQVLPGSGLNVRWLCAQCHSWKARIQHRINGIGCPYCSGQRATLETSLAIYFPILAQEWHPTLNAPLTSEQVKPRSNLRVWWQCLKDPQHPAFLAIIDNRVTHGSGCPQCREIQGSRLEDLFANALDAAGICYERQKIIGSYRADFYLEDPHLLIEIQGCYWHGCLTCGFDQPMHKQFRSKDIRRRRYLKQHGYTIDEIWEHDFPLDEKLLAQFVTLHYGPIVSAIPDDISQASSVHADFLEYSSMDDSAQ